MERPLSESEAACRLVVDLPPCIYRLLNRRCPCKENTSAELASLRREKFLQERRARLASTRFKHSQVLARGRVDLTAKLEALQESLSAAQATRSAIYASVAAAGNREITRAHEIVQKNKEKIRKEIEYRKTRLEAKLAAAEQRRELILQHRSRRMRSTNVQNCDQSSALEKRSSTTISFTQAAIKIQRFWRYKLCFVRARRFLSLHLQHDIVSDIPFDVITDVLKSSETILLAGNILLSLGVDGGMVKSEFQRLCRTFLSTYMIIGHPQTILFRNGLFEDELVHSARVFAKQYSKWLINSAHGRLQCQTQTLTAWHLFLAAFEKWKNDDSAALVKFMVSQYCELDLIYQTIRTDSDPMVTAEYYEAIKENQLMLLVRIRRIVGSSTRELLRQAVRDARKKRSPTKAIIVANPKVDTSTKQTVEADKIEFFALGQQQARLSNRQLLHELLLNPNYTITKPTLSSARKEAEDEMKSNFFKSLERDLRSNRFCPWVPTIVQECKLRLLRLVMPNSPTFISISTTFDMTAVETQCRDGSFDLLQFTNTVVRMMQALCAPQRDNLVAEILCLSGTDRVTLFVAQMETIFSILEVLLLDTANFHLKVSSSRLIQEAVNYEKARFQDDLHKGILNLSCTTRWLKKSVLDMQSNLSSNEDISPESAKQGIHDVYHSAFAALLVVADDVPETFSLDVHRILDMQEEINVLVKTTSYLMAARNLMRTNHAKLNPLTWSSLRDRLYTLLTDSETIDPVSVALEVNNHLDLAYVGAETNRDERHLTLTNMLTSTTSLTPIQKLLRRRMRDLLRNSIAGEISTHQRITTGGFEDFQVRVHKVLERAQNMAKVNWQCYESWYSTIEL